ncbi:MAG: Gfo/Idh/MocA family oxidoreductase [Candidatus Poribacteria bacterium]|nr:Gfo/Idh/MocA family oxidoreductase [Candidatus Poribacteria bacterium]
MSQKVRLGIVGSGFMGQLAHIANYATIDDCELVALAEGRSETAQAIAQRYGIREVYPNHREMLEKAEIDGVVAVMGFHLYHTLVADILEAGKPTATEKPICLQSDSARKLVGLAEGKGLLYQVGYMKRHDPASKIVRKTVQNWKVSGEMGDMTYVRIAMPSGDWIYEHERPIDKGDAPATYDGQVSETAPAWMGELGRQYIGFINFYIHQVNLLRYLIGEDYTVTYVDPRSRILVAISDSGVPCTLEMAPCGLRNRWEESYRICFDGGRIDLQLPAPMARQRAGDVAIYTGSGFGDGTEPQEIRPLIPQRWAFLEQARHFVHCLKTGSPTIAPASDAIKDLEVSEQYIRLLMGAEGNSAST